MPLAWSPGKLLPSLFLPLKTQLRTAPPTPTAILLYLVTTSLLRLASVPSL